jgi:glycosyltransferase involved in cell wall biosynthesis
MTETRYTVVLPVRNGGQYLHHCVESILAQRFGDFTLAVLDNQSTDGSLEWITSLRDARVKLFPCETALSIEANWARIMDVPKNEFMTIIGYDDILDPNYLMLIDRLIHRHPDAALYQTHFRLIDAGGRILRSCRPMPEYETAADFLAGRLTDRYDSFGTGYVVRSALYEQVGGIPNYAGLIFADDALWLKCMHRSWKSTAADECFSYRRHAASAARRADWRVILDAADDYTILLVEQATNDPAVRQVLQRHGAQWFGRCLLGIFISAHLSAFSQDGLVPPGLLDRCSSILSRVAPDAGGEFGRSTIVRGLERLGRLRGRRLLSRAFEPLWLRILAARVR